jgi:hypothetical protein
MFCIRLRIERVSTAISVSLEDSCDTDAVGCFRFVAHGYMRVHEKALHHQQQHDALVGDVVFVPEH